MPHPMQAQQMQAQALRGSPGVQAQAPVGRNPSSQRAVQTLQQNMMAAQPQPQMPPQQPQQPQMPQGQMPQGQPQNMQQQMPPVPAGGILRAPS